MKLDCGHAESEHTEHTTGYGRDEFGKTLCYECCANGDREFMVKHGKWTGYLVRREINFGREQYAVTNWPGSLEFIAFPRVKHGRHNIARTRTDAWFIGPDKYIWHAVQYGDNTQIAHCTRTKEIWG